MIDSVGRSRMSLSHLDGSQRLHKRFNAQFTSWEPNESRKPGQMRLELWLVLAFFSIGQNFSEKAEFEQE